ncbi:MAG: carbohydrate kinase family protein [Spirochaetaceae bacterium]|nr:carbohydrate kinase family protein [Spirochaetaceae bacterium]
MIENGILIIGDINTDLIMTGLKKYPGPGEETFANDFKIKIGGGAAISALALSKLGINSSIFGWIGDDIFSDLLTNELKIHSINLEYITIAKNTSTGISIVLTNEKNRSFITYKDAFEYADINNITDEMINNYEYIFLHKFIPSKIEEYIKFCKKVKSKGKKIIFDVGFDAIDKWDNNMFDLLKYVDVFIPDELEALGVTRSNNIEDALKKLSIYCNRVVIKAGKNGAIALDGGKIIYSPIYPANVVDTTGAGDSFDAGFVYGIVNNLNLEKCLALGNFLGSLSVSCLGGSTGIPEHEELFKLLKSNSIL